MPPDRASKPQHAVCHSNCSPKVRLTQRHYCSFCVLWLPSVLFWSLLRSCTKSLANTGWNSCWILPIHLWHFSKPLIHGFRHTKDGARCPVLTVSWPGWRWTYSRQAREMRPAWSTFFDLRYCWTGRELERKEETVLKQVRLSLTPWGSMSKQDLSARRI